MARSTVFSNPGEEDDLYSASPATAQSRRRAARTQSSPSPLPETSPSSDKENRQASTARSRQGKRDMPPPQLPSNRAATPRTTKKRRLGDHDARLASQIAHERELEEAADTQFYDPDQDIEERRAIRKGLRDLTRELTESRSEYLAAGSTGISDTLRKANGLFSVVKQTSDATLDSRLLVTAADLSYKKTTQLTLGDTSQGIDVDEFVSKCITFMRRGPNNDDEAPQGSGNSSRRRRRNAVGDDDDVSGGEGSGDEGDAMNWDWLGRKACFPYSLRPPVPGFLLGPLSVQKRVRVQRARRERLQRRNPADVVRPEELKATDIEKVENSNLTFLCRGIREVLARRQTEGQDKVGEEATEDTSEDELKALMSRHGICDDGGVSLFRFVINPHSFGQTVENLFYVSFLIRDGSVGIGKDGDGLPTLHASEPRKKSEIREQGVQKHQAVFSIDYATWEDIIEALNIRESVIPDRKSEDAAPVSATGWYG
ncbi:MAG: hypothetical protein M1819_004511 [Sarea resinae]|nr:MAG: hypothetical protein M1819_004511 [Sarea resinae]